MLIEQQIKHYRALDTWFQSPLGLTIAQEFTSELEQVNSFIKGDTLLQLGSCGDNPWLKTLDYKHQWIASPFPINNKKHVECSLSQLPLSRSSIDCLIAPLALEPFAQGCSLIDEIDRVLNPMGFVILLSINPWSLWGGAMKCGLLHCYDNKNIKLRTPFHINRIFMQRGYRQCSISNFCYIPPFKNAELIKKFTFMNEIGKMLWPFPSGVYCYIAQKYQYITPSPIPVALAEQDYESALQSLSNS